VLLFCCFCWRIKKCHKEKRKVVEVEEKSRPGT
jgi:hypothetical protein